MGLTPTEARIYLEGLTGTSHSLQELSRATRIKRPTLYHALHTLMEKGLVAEKKDVNKSFFTMADPRTLAGLLERQRDEIGERMETLTTLIPLLLKRVSSSRSEEISVVQYHGIQGMKTVVDIACFCKSHRWDIIAPYWNFLREYDPAYIRRYLRAKKSHHILSRTLWELTPKTRTLSAEEIRERNPRTLPASMRGRFKSMIILFDDKVAIFSSYAKKTAILITSKEIHEMFRTMFDAIWEVSEQPYA
jgi:sugar-specific transcriptional regulator TrmB